MFVIIDIETTGNNSKYSRITELAVCQHNGQNITHIYSTLINPGIDIPYYITNLTGIDNNEEQNYRELKKQQSQTFLNLYLLFFRARSFNASFLVCVIFFSEVQ